jgi:polysaccharide biosynthesis/export protein
MFVKILMFVKNGLLCVALLVAMWPLSAAAQTEQAPRTSYVLGPDDQLVIHALDVPDISEKPQRLDPSGDLRLPMIGRVHAAGMTVEQLEAELTTRLKVFLQQPDVTVTVTESQSQPVSIIGAVRTSGVHQVAGSKTLIQVLSLAGGLSDDAGPTLKITRRLELGRIPLPESTVDPTGKFSTVEIDVRALLNAQNPEKNIVISPYDVISVPRAETVYVVGEVGRPGALPLTGGTSITVLQAVSSSGGVLRTGAPSRASILRRTPGQEKRTQLPINIQKIMQGKADDVALASGDILVVPDSSGKRVTARVLEALIQTGTLVGTYGIMR